MSTQQAQRTNALITMPENRMQVEHSIDRGWTVTEYIAGRAAPRRSFASWPELTQHIRHYAGVITCNHAVARALAGGQFLIETQESSNG